jgi:hypothetical protein
MKNKFALSLAFSMFILSAWAYGAPLDADGPEACWQKGVQAARISKDYVPGRIYVKFERLDSDGKTVDLKETWLEVRPGENRGTLLRVLENGKDITREELDKESREKEEAKGKKNDGGHFINLSSEELVPLLTNSKKPVAYQHLGKEKDRDVECQVYKFQKDYIRKKGPNKETVTQQGRIWLDAGSGMPVRSSYTPAPLPSMVQQMDMDTTYFSEGGMFYIKTHKMVVKAGILFLKKRFRISFVLGGYRKSEKENQGG